MARPASRDDDVVWLPDVQDGVVGRRVLDMDRVLKLRMLSRGSQTQNAREPGSRLNSGQVPHEELDDLVNTRKPTDAGVLVLSDSPTLARRPASQGRMGTSTEQGIVDLTDDLETAATGAAAASSQKRDPPSSAGRRGAVRGFALTVPLDSEDNDVEVLPDDAAIPRAPKRRRLAEDDRRRTSTALEGSAASPAPVSQTDAAGDSAASGSAMGTFSCAVCYDEHSMEDCFVASMCRHQMCRDAARQVVLSAIRDCAFPILCPICQARSDPACAKCDRRRTAATAVDPPVGADGGAGPPGAGSSGPPSAWCCSLDADIPLLLSVEEEERYHAHSLKAATNACPDLLPCPQPDCPGVAVAGHEDDSPRLVCNVCEHNWCKSCEVAWHEGKSCDDHMRECGETAAEAAFKKYEKKHTVKRCPFCNHGLMKISGCDHITCAGCKTAMCWSCLQRMADCGRTQCNGRYARAAAAAQALFQGANPGAHAGAANLEGWAAQMHQALVGAYAAFGGGAAFNALNPPMPAAAPAAAAAAPAAVPSRSRRSRRTARR